MCLQRIKHYLYSKMKFLKQAIYIRYGIAKLSKIVQITMQTSSDSFLQRILWKSKGPGASFQFTFIIEFFDKNVSFVILHKLAKFHYQTVFTTHVIQINMFCDSYLSIWWRHYIWISEKLKFDYLKNEKSFRRAFSSFRKWSPLDLTNYQK